jgi:hypothetical protein
MKKGRVQPGARFGRLTILSRIQSSRNECGQYRWKVRCECGNVKEIWGYTIAKQKSSVRSCGECGYRKRSDPVINAEKDAMKKQPLVDLEDEEETNVESPPFGGERSFECPECPSGLGLKTPEDLGRHLERHFEAEYHPAKDEQHKFYQCKGGCGRWYPKKIPKSISKDFRRHEEMCDGQKPILKVQQEAPKREVIPLVVIDRDPPKERPMSDQGPFHCVAHPEVTLRSAQAFAQHWRHNHKGEPRPEKKLKTTEAVPRFTRVRDMKNGKSDNEISDRKKDVVRSLRALVDALKSKRDSVDVEVQEYDEILQKMEEGA